MSPTNSYSSFMIDALLNYKYLVLFLLVLSLMGFFLIPYLENYQKKVQKQISVQKNKK